MCGICGVIDYNSNSTVKDEVLLRMSKELTHRGPDDGRVYLDRKSTPHVGLGHRRLKIIDLSSMGAQPMSNEDGSVWLILNGEIYNYPELRSGLEEKGHTFKSHSDTEVVVHLYEEYGKDCVAFLRGMFAFAIWDQNNRQVFLARDRIGKKPLVYYSKNGVFCFASEFSSLLASGLVKKTINPEAMHYYLTFGYIPAPLTIYRDVWKLPPAHILTMKDNQLSIEQYWELDYSKKIKISEEDASGELLRLLRESTKIRLYSDVPIGAFLSGGIDSSAIVALMSQVSTSKVKTFSIGFKEQDYSELKFAKIIAEKFGTEHHEFVVEPKALDILPLLVERYGEPYADSSCIPTYYVASQTRNFVTVALNGDGGDESFAGYERYQGMLLAESYNKLPSAVKNAMNSISKHLPFSNNPKNRLRNIKRFMEAAPLSTQERYLRWVGIFNRDLLNSLYTDEFKKLVINYDPLDYLRPYLNASLKLSLIDKLLSADVHTYLPNDLLVKADIACMANSLEGRSPFLDHKFMEYAASLPSGYKMKYLIKKYLLKKSIRDLVPKENVYRRKMGFGMPIGKWFRNDLKSYLIDNILSDSAVNRAYFKKDILNKLVLDHCSGKNDHSFQLWALLMLELWHQRFID